MTLSCSCDDWNPNPGDIGWYTPCDFSIYARKRATRCISCGKRIAPGAVVSEWRRLKIPDSEIECRIYGEDGEIPMASHFHCETCAGLSFSLSELGYCAPPYEDQRALVREYATMHERPESTP